MAKQMGFLTVDHRASPGLPEDVARWAGYDPNPSTTGVVFNGAVLASTNWNFICL